MSDLAIGQAGRLDGGDRRERLEQAAAAFEGFFLREILSATESKGMFGERQGALFDDGPAGNQFKALLNDALIERSAGGIGIAELIVQHVVAGGHVVAKEADDG
ncbi:MAG: hypothetical protein ACYTF0_07100 [Planctomycetota bacterium]|jgi:Rod binding domain-containing protein